MLPSHSPCVPARPCFPARIHRISGPPDRVTHGGSSMLLEWASEQVHISGSIYVWQPCIFTLHGLS